MWKLSRKKTGRITAINMADFVYLKWVVWVEIRKRFYYYLLKGTYNNIYMQKIWFYFVTIIFYSAFENTGANCGVAKAVQVSFKTHF